MIIPPVEKCNISIIMIQDFTANFKGIFCNFAKRKGKEKKIRLCSKDCGSGEKFPAQREIYPERAEISPSRKKKTPPGRVVFFL
jgi:hypothetical protein